MNALNIGIFICSFKNIIEAVMKIWKPKTKLKLTNYSSSYKSLFRHYQNDNALPAIMSVVFFLYSVNLTECVAIDTRVSVGVSVCVSVYVSVSSLQPKRMDGFWWNFPQITYCEFARSVFLRFWKFKFDDVMPAIIAVFGWDTLMVAILLRFCLHFRMC